VARFHEKNRRLSKETLTAEVKIFRLRRQKQLIRDRLRALKDCKIRNIAELKIDEMIAENIRVIFSLKTLNSPSPRSSSFLNPTFLNSQNKNPITSQDSS
jgi:hypothetical protein